MSKTFKFGDGSAPNGAHLDVRGHRPSAVWTRGDLNYAVQAYCRNHTAEQATEIFYHACRVTHPDHVPDYAFGAVIGLLVVEITDRQYETEVAHRPTLRLPMRKDIA
jgi:hypothetical protein